MSEDDTAWAQLVCVTDTDTPPFLITKDKFTIGRAEGCDISHKNNQLVSSKHCYILRDGLGKVWLYDTSTNGTLLNTRIKLGKGQRQELEHGDEIHVVHKKGENDVNIGYVFQDMVRLKEEEAQDTSGSLEGTLEYPNEVDATIVDDSMIEIDEDKKRSPVKRKRAPSTEAGPSDKRARGEDKDNKASSPADGKEKTRTAAEGGGDGHGDKGSKKDDKEPEKSAASEKDGKKEEEGKGGKEGAAAAAAAGSGEDGIKETLTCIICQEILHDCISLQPCMHSFCSGCYSEWMATSKDCPSCRTKVDRINKNHLVNNLVEAYLKEHPDSKRPDEDIQELDAKNKITRDMLYKKNSDSESEDDEEDSDEDNNPTFVPVHFAATPAFFRPQCRQCPAQPGVPPAPATGLFQSTFNIMRNIFSPTTTTTAPTADATTTATTTAAASTSGDNDTNNNTDQPGTSTAGTTEGEQDYLERDKKTLPDPPAYTCALNQNHVLCQCCHEIFPDRRNEHLHNPNVPPQRCTICFRNFCHAYWGCRNANCHGCLNKFQDLNFGRGVLPGLILDNPTESKILTNYLNTKKMAVRDLLEVCITKMNEGTYTSPDQTQFRITGQTPLCYTCGLRNFKVLAYQYRANIPDEELPVNVRSRSNCHWGKNCRTQRNKPHHAERFNHICEQTRV